MKEKILTEKKNGMAVLILALLLYIIAVPVMVIGAAMNTGLGWAIFVAGLVWVCLGWIVFLGL